LRHARQRSQRKCAQSIAAIILLIIREAATYALDPDMSETAAIAYWMGDDKETFVAEEDGVVLGIYYMRPNQAGWGRHVCNCGYMTHAAARGRGVCATHVRAFARACPIAWLSRDAVQLRDQHE
jgi:hypothetical protein